MQPDLFAGPAQRDDSHRILARLANGGSAPAPARQWGQWNTAQRARMAAVVALLAAIAAAWAWLQDMGSAQQAQRQVEAAAAPAPVATVRASPYEPQESQAATIVNEPARSVPATPPTPVQATARYEARVAHLRTVRPTVPPRGPRNEPSAERDEDVTLLTAMLKHANGQKQASTPPGD